MSAKFPVDFRLPENVDYVETVDMGILRTPFETGHSRQRRRYVNMPTVAQLTFVIRQNFRGRFQQWWNAFGSGPEYFEMPMPTMRASLNNQRCINTLVRGISDLEISPRGTEHWEIRVLVEFHPGWAAGLTTLEECDWIIAGTPAAPATDTFTAGTPAAPGTDTVTAGTPATVCHH